MTLWTLVFLVSNGLTDFAPDDTTTNPECPSPEVVSTIMSGIPQGESVTAQVEGPTDDGKSH